MILGMGVRRACLSAVVLAVAVPAALNSQQSSTPRDPSSAWTRVEQLHPGLKVKLRLVNGETVKGKIVEVNSDGIALRLKGEQVFKAAKEQVRAVRKRSRLIGLTLGALIGAGGGATVGAVGPKEGDERRAPYVIGGALMGAGIGAGIGGAIGKEITIYEYSPAADRGAADTLQSPRASP